MQRSTFVAALFAAMVFSTISYVQAEDKPAVATETVTYNVSGMT